MSSTVPSYLPVANQMGAALSDNNPTASEATTVPVGVTLDYNPVSVVNQNPVSIVDHGVVNVGLAPPIADPTATTVLGGIEMKPRYYRCLVEFMSFRDNVEYPMETTFSEHHLRGILPVDIERWFKKKVYGTTEPSALDFPTQQKPSSLEHYKKALSFYMPDREIVWHEATRTGNPTKSFEVNDLIKNVKLQFTMLENQQKQNQLDPGSFGPKPPTKKKIKLEDILIPQMQYLEKQAPKKFELDTSYLDSTLEEVDAKSREIDISRLIKSDDTIPSNKLAQDQFCALYREMLSLRKEIQGLTAPKPLHVHGKKPPIRRTDMDFKLDLLDARMEQPSFEELILSNIDEPTQITGEGLRHDQFRVLFREMLVMRKEMRAVVATLQTSASETSSSNTEPANFHTPMVPPLPDTKSTAWQRQFNPNANSTVDCRPATLCENPKTLYVLWQEYMYGIHGRKPAREFTKQDKAAVRARYSQRRVIWDQINKLMRSKHRYTANEAIEKIYSVYGIRTPVTVIIKRIREDIAKSEGNPELSVIEQFMTDSKV